MSGFFRGYWGRRRSWDDTADMKAKPLPNGDMQVEPPKVVGCDDPLVEQAIQQAFTTGREVIVNVPHPYAAHDARMREWDKQLAVRKARLAVAKELRKP